MTDQEKLDHFNETGELLYSENIQEAMNEHELNKYFKQRCKEQITEPTDCSFIKDHGTGYLIRLTGGVVTLKNKLGDCITISESNLFELLKERVKKWKFV